MPMEAELGRVGCGAEMPERGVSKSRCYAWERGTKREVSDEAWLCINNATACW